MPATTTNQNRVLYVIMMYVAVYPIAMSVRSTNVYEEKSLGLFHDDDDSEMEMKEIGSSSGSEICRMAVCLTSSVTPEVEFH